MNWSDFSSLVRTHLHIHNRRQGIQTLIETLIQAAMLDLQSSIPELRLRSTTVFTVPDLSGAFVSPDTGFFYVSGPVSVVSDDTAYAQTGVLPVGHKVTRAYARLASDHSQTDDYEFFDLRKIDQIQTGVLVQSPRRFVHDPANGRFFISPPISDDDSELVVLHEGYKSDFQPSDEIPVDAFAAATVAEFVLIKLSMDVDRDPQAAQIHRQLYLSGKRKLMSDLRENLLPPLIP